MRLKQNNVLIPLEELLVSGGDARIVLDRSGANKYGCFAFPRPEILSYSSSTASTISSAGFAASAQLYEQLEKASRREAACITYAREMTRIRGELAALYDLDSLLGTDIIFGASGTDLHLFAAQLVCKANSSLRVIMCEASETGSGVKAALEGRHFSTQTALGGTATQGKAIGREDGIDVISVNSRLRDGSLRPEAIVDAEVEALATQAIASGRHVLLTLTDVSKTGLITPSLECAFALKHRFGETIDILIDACQFRLAVSTLRAYLEHGFLLAVTGSKFVAGPAFCAALLIPHANAQRLRSRVLPAALSAYSARVDWPQGWAAQRTLSDTANFGLLLRFEAALAELHAFHALHEAQIQSFLEAFASVVEKKLADDPVFEPLLLREMDRQPLTSRKSWDHIPTIFPFFLRHRTSGKVLSRDETVRVYQLMQQDLGSHPGILARMRHVTARRCQLGQPVACGMRNGIPISALRLNIDMRLIGDALSQEGRGAKAIIAEALSVLDKTALLVKHLLAPT